MKKVYRGYFKIKAHVNSNCLILGHACTRDGKELAYFELRTSALHSEVLAKAIDQGIVQQLSIFDMTYCDVEEIPNCKKGYRVSLRGVVDWNVK